MANKETTPPHRAVLAISGVIFLILSVLLIDTVIDIWPSVGAQSEMCKKLEPMPIAEREPLLVKLRKAHKISCRFRNVPVTRVNLGGTHTFLTPDQGMFGLVGIFAALAALLRSLRAVVMTAIGRSTEEFSLLWNLFRPLQAAVLAIIAYVIARALFLPPGTLASVNPYGYVALGAVIGFFSGELACWAISRGKALTGK